MSESKSLFEYGFEGIVAFAEGGGAAIPRIDAKTFEEAAAHILSRVDGRTVKSVEITDLRYEESSKDTCECGLRQGNHRC